jgi:putative hydrolase of the HAD superfamily
MAKVEAMGIGAHMKAIVISEQVGVSKPSPEIFMTALTLIGAQASEALFVGDDPVADIVGAHNAGIPAVWLRRGRSWTLDRVRPTQEIDSLLELLISR